MSSALPVIATGDWQQLPEFDDYRAEWVSDMLIERATWTSDAPPQQLGGKIIAGPRYVWFRFWLVEGDRLVEKYFDAAGVALGMYTRVGMALPHQGRGLSLLDLVLGIWITDDLHVTIQHESRFEAAVRAGDLTPVEVEYAEHQIRELTTAIAYKRFPPAIVRNMTLTKA